MKRFLYLISALIFITACKEVFETPPQSLLKASLVNSSTKNALTSSVTVQGTGLDSLWVYETSMTEMMLPLSSNDTTSFLISLDSKIDTVTFLHVTYQKYISMESGFYFEYKLHSIDYSHNRIDSIQIIDSLVTKNWHENIKLYIRPLPAGN
ncbi:MAG: DUF6452 family protein [Bacteroidota bacterium]|nr:DUF6452 family protein [Bacteroidota bacterium]